MDADQQAGLAGLLALVHDLLWWGGLAGVVVLVRLSLSAAPGEGGAPPATEPSSGLAGQTRVSAVRDGGRGTAVMGAPAVRSAAPPAADRLVLLAGLTVAASGVHAVMVPAHAGAALVVPSFFAVVAAVQAWQAARLLLAPSRELLVTLVALDVVLLTVWAVSRTVGVLGPAEPVGPWDAAVVVWQAACVLLGVRLLGRARGRLRPPSLVPQRWGSGTQVALVLTGLTLLLLPGAGHG